MTTIKELIDSQRDAAELTEAWVLARQVDRVVNGSALFADVELTRLRTLFNEQLRILPTRVRNKGKRV